MYKQIQVVIYGSSVLNYSNYFNYSTFTKRLTMRPHTTRKIHCIKIHDDNGKNKSIFRTSARQGKRN